MSKFKKPSLSLVIAVFICLSLTTAGTVSASNTLDPLTQYHDVDLKVINDNGARFDIFGDGTYNFFNPDQTATMGLNALHINKYPNNVSVPYGQVTNTSATSGTFYLTDTGGRGWDDDGILMIAINGTIPDDFSIEISSSGYQWTPVDKISQPSNITYVSNAMDQTFDISDFTGDNSYGPLCWRPSTGSYYPIYDGQNVTEDISNNNTFHYIFVDLYAGIIGNNESLINNGSITVNYAISGLPDDAKVSFDAYAFCNSSNQGQGIRWTNSVNKAGNNSGSTTSGYNVASWYAYI